MDNQQLLLLKNKNINESSEDTFRYYARPLTAKLLETMEMSKHFFHGEGDYLFYEQDKKIHKVLDLTGGYGANILGHRHPQVLSKIESWSKSGAPSLTQGSNRKEAGRLAKKLSDILTDETGEGPWVTTFTNSGTEAVEAAYKHSLIYFKHKLIELEQEVEKEINQSLLVVKKADDSFGKKLLQNLRKDLMVRIDLLQMEEERKSYFLHQMAYVQTVEELVELIRLINKKQLSEHPKFLALEKAFHGKTMGSLSLTFNESFRDAFYLGGENNSHTTFISQYIDQKELADLMSTFRKDLILLVHEKNAVVWSKHSFSLLAGAFVEPIQGEAGVIPVNTDFLGNLKKHSLQDDFLLVFDEIQSGMYRTGKLSAGTHSGITPDVYTFSKSLGGGVAKIAATTVNHRKYVEEFGFLHTSTFSDDDFSSSVALEVLEILQGENSPVASGMQTSTYLLLRLETLRDQFPEVIKDIRGTGLMLAIEFHDLLAGMGFEFKTICDSKMQGYMMASVLLNHENVRMSPSLSNSLTLRVQPSLYFSIIQVEELFTALKNLCEALKTKNVAYFLSSIYPNQSIENVRTPDLATDLELGKRPLSVFLCHLIDEAHVKKVTGALRGVSGEVLMRKLALTKDLAEFEIYHAQTIEDADGQEMDIVMLGIPVSSEELKKTFLSRNKYKVVQKVQNAIDFAKELGASTVGLGQFTSIVSGNGMYLNPRGMNLTTGNAFTIALTVQSALKSAKEKSVETQNATAALIGAAGNIMSVATSLMADHVEKLLLIHHTPIESSLKFQQATRKILDEIARSQETTPVTETISKLWDPNCNLIDFLNLPEVSKVFVASSDVTLIQEAEIVLCGASASNGFLTPELFKENAVVVDVAVPPSIKPEILAKLTEERKDLTYHLGGVAAIPRSQSIDFFIFPLAQNECYACMAETFALGFSGEKDFLNIGDLDKRSVLRVEQIAEKAGFVLGNFKNKSSL